MLLISRHHECEEAVSPLTGYFVLVAKIHKVQQHGVRLPTVGPQHGLEDEEHGREERGQWDND